MTAGDVLDDLRGQLAVALEAKDKAEYSLEEVWKLIDDYTDIKISLADVFKRLDALRTKQGRP